MRKPASRFRIMSSVLYFAVFATFDYFIHSVVVVVADGDVRTLPANEQTRKSAA